MRPFLRGTAVGVSLLLILSCTPFTGPQELLASLHGSWTGSLAADIEAFELIVNDVDLRVLLDGTLQGEG